MDTDFGTLIEPAPVPFTFGAPGWYVLAASVCILLCATVWVGVYLYKRNRYRKQALHWLAEREKTLHATNAFELLVYDASMLIKRIAMARYGRNNVAGIDGQAWINFLNKTGRGKQFTDMDAQLLQQTLYSTEKIISETEANAFVHKTKHWIATHKHAF
jgi:hypothetical protein